VLTGYIAIGEFLRAVYLKPNYAKPYNNIGVVYYGKEEFSSAIRNYQKAIKIYPQNLEALNNLAVVLKKLVQLEKAKAILNQALKLGASHAGDLLQHCGFIRRNWQQQVSHSFLSGICETWIVQPPFAGSGS